ncbi:ribosome small subunit-dependent GTPase A [Mammaliicoccus lentus]|uniref:ribosome small subunit-dependent GTPase A n=1 Tax=Mammaliicoccus lentus TaxID=42858 RepID=UPI000305B3C9|nr:ribosome small subunit-dependent GTPase A [Mammaliicoccus lentus]MBW0768193.1 ribosome small subunit-dependent GTPase A [Mammaliicoccus lentus]QMU10749.1 ribosome small subunit-dependent GTPase A [Mammaliicoccus lentus]WGZ43423.1 ribosome small subunit-dependent GTPase A [Mammaliicoccus lentus]WQL54942.1 ribosome small subunit-dependent GTPase A [Mammaliicoccus lentus]SCU37156.1 ribosome small subunit-stimulated GTPase EngC [Mammaliicoccus lentus]
MKTGRIIKSISGDYSVQTEDGVYITKARGLFRKKKTSPTVGDVVDFQVENETGGYIQHIHERENILLRPPVSNINKVIVVMSAVEPELSQQLLDRFLVVVHSYNISPVICVTKKDLATDKQSAQIKQLLNEYKMIGYETIFVGNDDDLSLTIKPLIKGIIVLSGQSGVGKSSMMNRLFEDLNIETNKISKALNRGKHTTRHVELFEMEDGFLADTPGFSALDFSHIEKEDLTNYFPEFEEVKSECKFRNCTHINEPKCAVKTLIEEREFYKTRYNHYVALFEEIQNRKVRY